MAFTKLQKASCTLTMGFPLETSFLLDTIYSFIILATYEKKTDRQYYKDLSGTDTSDP